MVEVTGVGDMEVPEDLAFEERSYTVRKIAAAVFGLLLVAGLLGLFGRSGPLSDTTASSGSIEVGYERFLRLDSATELQVEIGAGSGPTEIAISQDFLEDFHVEGFSAEPQSTTIESDRVVYTFDQLPPSQVTFVLEPEEIGRQMATVYGPGGSELSFSQWVWP